MESILEPVGPDDAEEVSAMAFAIIPEVYPQFGEEINRMFCTRAQSPEAIRSSILAGERYFFVISGGEKVGYVGYSMNDSELHVDKLYLLPEARGKGLGRKVMETILDEAKAYGCPLVSLTVNVDNKGARRFYERLGFEFDRELRNPYTVNHRLVLDPRRRIPDLSDVLALIGCKHD